MKVFPKISVITVCYNSAKDIERTILSVINQDYNDIEYIIIDGGSTDGTLDIINKYERQVSHIVSEPDNGLYDAMNKGIIKATGEWVTMRNCGDLFAEKDSLAKIFKDPIPNDVDFICADAYRVRELGYYIVSSKDISQNNYKMSVVHPATFVRTTWHQQHLFNTRYRVSADYNLIYNSVKAGRKFIFKHIPIVIFPVGGYSSTHWYVAKREGQIIRGNYCTSIQKARVETNILIHRVLFLFRKISKKIPIIKQIRDKKLIERYSIRPLPIPLEKFY